MKTKYRIVCDNFSGFEVQKKRWWFPVWMQVGINTHSSIENAKAFIEACRFVEVVE